MKLVLVRHGESIWNKENRFTGWSDIELTDKGKRDAINAGKLLKENGFTFDFAYTSYLIRAIDTLKYILKELELDIPINYSWMLNERHYGALQGLNKDDTKLKYGEEQVRLWRRSVDVCPPLLDVNDSRNPIFDSKYKDIDPSLLPLGECLNDTSKRVIEYFNSNIRSKLLDDKKVIIVAHGNSLRALIRYLDDLSDEEVMNLEIETGRAIVYELDDELKPITHYYL